MREFADFLAPLGLATQWGEAVDPAAAKTTLNARTFMQPQLNKAVKMSDKMTKGDHNPKVGGRPGPPRWDSTLDESGLPL